MSEAENPPRDDKHPPLLEDWYKRTGFCGYGCGMWGVNHAANDALCHRRQRERYDRPHCALIYLPEWLAERHIAEG